MLKEELYKILIQSSVSSLHLQKIDGSMPPGHNGPYNDPETAIRNTAHWVMLFFYSFGATSQQNFLEAALRGISFLKMEFKKSENKAFHCRNKTGKDLTNGLIGQAWALEPFSYMQKFKKDHEAIKIALSVIKSHPFDKKKGLWKTIDLDGTPKEIDNTFNHQLWFACSSAQFAQYDNSIKENVDIFLKKMFKNLVLHRNGRIGQSRYLNLTESILKPLLKKFIKPKDSRYMRLKEVGYHAFNTYAFAKLKDVFKFHSVWRDKRFFKILLYFNVKEYKKDIWKSKYGFPYNPPGFEVLATQKAFQDGVEFDENFIKDLIDHQLQEGWDNKKKMMVKGCFDKMTSAARVYEAISYCE
tara:strand:+ start:3255 stop:4322 length:1068 start_codon:yes stop_codon:yes gene_type:complete